MALAFVKNKFMKLYICEEAVRNNGLAIDYVPKPNYSWALREIDPSYDKHDYKEKYYDLCMIAVTQNGNALEFIDGNTQTCDLCVVAMRNTSFCKAFKHVINKTQDICIEAINQNMFTFFDIENKTEEIIIEFLKNDKHGMMLEVISEQNEKICLEAVKINGLALKYVINQTENICLEAVKQNGLALQYVEEQTYQICLEAVKENKLAFEFIDNNFKDDSMRFYLS
jgi:hypothetical protein